jgi:hypothetical protein
MEIMKHTMKTEYIGKPMTTLNAIRKGKNFFAVGPAGLNFKKLNIGVNVFLAAPISTSIKRIAAKAKAMGLSDETATIHQVCRDNGKEYSYEYSIDKN